MDKAHTLLCAGTTTGFHHNLYLCGLFNLFTSASSDDIEVIFYEDKPDQGMNVQPWMAKGRFGPNDVHHQVGMVYIIHLITLE